MLLLTSTPCYACSEVVVVALLSPSSCFICSPFLFIICTILTGVSQDCGTAVVDLVFVVDSSGSIEQAGQGNWNLVLNFVNRVINELNIGEFATRVAVTRFANIGESMFYLNTDYNKQSIQNRVVNIGYVDGNTNTSGGIRDMHFNQFTAVNGDRPNVQNVAIIITDGVSTWDKDRTIPDAIDARNDGIKIISVGITNAIDENELRQMSSMPQEEGKNYFRSAGFNELDTIVDSIVAETCSIVSSGKAIKSGSDQSY